MPDAGVDTFISPSGGATTQVQGTLKVIADPYGTPGNVTAAGSLVVSGGLTGDMLPSLGTTPTASSQSASSANTPITMTSGVSLGGPNIIYVQASGTATASILLTPTSSASTSGIFQDGVEITMVNNSASGTNIAIPSGNFGSLSGTPASLAIAAGHAVRFKYIAALQTWTPLVN